MIVEEIVDNLWPFKGGNSRDGVTAEVAAALNLLIEAVPQAETFSDRTALRKHTKKIDAALAKIEALILSSPPGLNSSLFNPSPLELMEPTEDGGYVLKEPWLGLTNDLTREEMVERLGARSDAFLNQIRKLRIACSRQYGTHPNFGHSQIMSALTAYGLMEGLTKNEITGTADGRFRTIAKLLNEGASGNRGIDVKRACDEVLRLKSPREHGTDST